MNGMKPNFLSDKSMHVDYYKKINPYINAPSCHVNLLEMSRYAKKCGKKLVELTADEVKKFSI